VTIPTEGLSILASLLLAIYSVAVYANRRGVSLGGVAIVGAFIVIDARVGDFGFLLGAFSAAWLVGLVVRRQSMRVLDLVNHTSKLDRDRERAAALGALEERQRIARELHDIIAHRVSMIVVQAQAADALIHDDIAAARNALSEIDRAGRAALTELRTLLGVLRDVDENADRAPQPDLSGIDELIHAGHAAGLQIDLLTDVRPEDVPPAVAIAAYRIVQEGLTNVVKHGGSAPTSVALRFDRSSLVIDIVDCGPGPAGTSAPGYGLAGMRQRAELLGGSLVSGAAPGGGFMLRACLPLGGSA